MEKLEHELWIVQAVNAAFGPMAAALLRALGRPVPAHGDIIPDYLVMSALIGLPFAVASRRLSGMVGRLQLAVGVGSFAFGVFYTWQVAIGDRLLTNLLP